MKTYYLFCSVLFFVTCFVFTWNAESYLGEVLGFIALVGSMIGIGKNIVSKLNA